MAEVKVKKYKVRPLYTEKHLIEFLPQAHLNDKGAEREARLTAKVEELEKELQSRYPGTIFAQAPFGECPHCGADYQCPGCGRKQVANQQSGNAGILPEKDRNRGE